jgi:hypothetical protein
MLEITGLAENPLAFQEGLCSMELVRVTWGTTRGDKAAVASS